MTYRTAGMISLLVAGIILPVAVIGAGPRVSVSVDQVTASRGDTMVTVPVRLSNPVDSIAGAELYFKIKANRRLRFASDEKRPDGLSMAVDTSGTLMSGWEWIGISTLDNTLYDLKVAGMADWPNQKRTPPLSPQQNGVLFKLVFRVDPEELMTLDSLFTVTIVKEKCGLADPLGNSIGVVTKTEQVCEQYKGDSCLSWKTVRKGALDSMVVRLSSGSVLIGDVSAGGR